MHFEDLLSSSVTQDSISSSEHGNQDDQEEDCEDLTIVGLKIEINELKNNEAAGYDRIASEIINKMGTRIEISLVYIIYPTLYTKLSLEHKAIPMANYGKVTSIVLIHRKGYKNK